jgi:soluble lytic murein transglycosylase-like protein
MRRPGDLVGILQALVVLQMLIACQPASAPPADAPAAPTTVATEAAIGPGVSAPPAVQPPLVAPAPAPAPVRPPPARAEQYRSDMTRSAYRVFGPAAPVSTLAGQIQQESGWRADARSPVGALGIAQFMPATAEDMARNHPADCAPADPMSTRWGFTCRDRYMASRLSAIKPMADGLATCDQWVFALRAYNGGLGWVTRDRRLALGQGADPDSWLAVLPFNAGRGAAFFQENAEYGPKILAAQQRFINAGWGPGVCT